MLPASFPRRNAMIWAIEAVVLCAGVAAMPFLMILLVAL